MGWQRTSKGYTGESRWRETSSYFILYLLLLDTIQDVYHIIVIYIFMLIPLPPPLPPPSLFSYHLSLRRTDSTSSIMYDARFLDAIPKVRVWGQEYPPPSKIGNHIESLTRVLRRGPEVGTILLYITTLFLLDVYQDNVHTISRWLLSPRRDIHIWRRRQSFSTQMMW